MLPRHPGKTLAFCHTSAAKDDDRRAGANVSKRVPILDTLSFVPTKQLLCRICHSSQQKIPPKTLGAKSNSKSGDGGAL
jgi:hypothetical protein